MSDNNPMDPTDREMSKLADENATLRARVEELERQKDSAYQERDALVCAISKVFPSSLGRHDESDTNWDNDWRWIVFVNLPTGQASWHIHDSERAMFDHLAVSDVKWDGHTTPEKYERLKDLTYANLAAVSCPACSAKDEALAEIERLMSSENEPDDDACFRGIRSALLRARGTTSPADPGAGFMRDEWGAGEVFQ